MTEVTIIPRSCLHALLASAFGWFFFILPKVTQAQEEWNPAAETLVVFNPDFPGAKALAQHYATARQIPENHLLALSCSNSDDISRSDFISQIRDPLLKAFTDQTWWKLGERRTVNDALATRVKSSQIRIITLIRGIPIRITRVTPGPEAGKEDESSVDSELMLLGMEPYQLPAFATNPFFKSPLPFHLHDTSPGLFLVSRLDGPDDATVKRLIDDSVRIESGGLLGRAVIDLALKEGPYEQGDEWLRRCATIYRQNGIPLYVDRSSDLIPAHWPLPDTALYFGWYQDRVGGVFADPTFRFAPGAVVCHLHSFSAARLRSATEHWTGPLLLRGAAATLGNVWEPYLAATCHFDLFNERLLSGATLAEAACYATPCLSWMQVVIGDPLYRPFKKKAHSLLGAEGRARDYALYQALTTALPKETDTPQLKSKLLKLGDKRQNPHLIELLGLLSGQSGDAMESANLFDHAASLYPAQSPDQQRARLYQAEALRTYRDFKAATKVLQAIADHPASSSLIEKLK